MTNVQFNDGYVGSKSSEASVIQPCSTGQHPKITAVILFYNLVYFKTKKKYFFLNNQPDALIIQIDSVTKLYMFRASSLPIIRSFLLYIQHW